MQNFWNSGFEPYEELLAVKANQFEFAQAHNDQQKTINQLIQNNNQFHQMFLDISKQHMQLTEIVKGHRQEIQRLTAEIQLLKSEQIIK